MNAEQRLVTMVYISDSVFKNFQEFSVGQRYNSPPLASDHHKVLSHTGSNTLFSRELENVAGVLA